MTTSKQTITNKKAEISYRNLLKKGKFKNQEFSEKELLLELKKRIKRTNQSFRKLQKQGIKLSPFLEIGAERGQRSILLASRFKAQGYMLDLSLESLKEAKKISKLMNFSKIPKSICADAYSLPFPDNSFSFVFVYQTLHHFPDPAPIIKEIHRVLAPGGTFFFDEEPIRQTFNLRLWRRPTKLRWWEKILKATLILHFISEIGKSETDAGIIEKSFNLPAWQKSLDIFQNIQTTISVFPFGPTQIIKKTNKKNWLSPKPTTHFLLKLLGGNLQAICNKSGSQKPTKPVLCCPTCKKHQPLKRIKQGFICPICHQSYPIIENIPILIEKNSRKILYA